MNTLDQQIDQILRQLKNDQCCAIVTGLIFAICYVFL